LKYLDQLNPICSVLLNDVIPFVQKKNGEPIVSDGKLKVIFKRKSDDSFMHMFDIMHYDAIRKFADTLPKYQFNNETYIQLKGITSEKDMVRKVLFTEIDLMDDKKIAIKYIDFQTDTIFMPLIQPMYMPLTHTIPQTGEVIEIDKIHVEDIHIGDIPMDYIITDNEIVILDIKDFQSRRLEHVKKVLEFDSIDEFKDFIKSPEDKHPPVEQKVDSSQLNNYGIKYLYHMTHISNLRSIIENGLLSHNQAHNQNLVNEDISDLGVNDRRNRKEPIYGNNLHDYVPFYFNPRNPMLYKRLALEDDILILKINPNILSTNKFLFTDGNAASKYTTIYSRLENLGKLDWKCINDEYWNKHNDGKRKICSEMLIYDFVAVEDISAVCCNNLSTKEKVSRILQNINIDVIVNCDIFF